ncbi:hypothetical protein CPC16_000762 [Podila verticillata]|nr:hypothetical protein BGZ52_004181 [Haplosporangium bisporale]KAF9211784.1 hypothetical protein BGZ59_007606 [Podila verticillata]KAF9393916.1 hypothetical protein CPC16_000762 [Podila verticillata]KAI9238490.1 MAG: hypothetical protein BYD32DRAFT_435698 [Podila humilis]
MAPRTAPLETFGEWPAKLGNSDWRVNAYMGYKGVTNLALYNRKYTFSPTVRLEEVCTNRGGVIQFYCYDNTPGCCDANSAWQKQMCYNHIEMRSDSLTCKDA